MVDGHAQVCDVLIVGSGAAGILAASRVAAAGRTAIVVEKTGYLGGTSAISGGWAWLPGNRRGRELGDSPDAVHSYIGNLSGGRHNTALLTQFLDAVPRLMEFLEDELGVAVKYADVPDYRMDVEGAQRAGRAVTFESADARMLGSTRLRVRPYHGPFTVQGYMPEVGEELATFLVANRSPRAFWLAARRVARHWAETALFGRSYRRTNGNAMMTRLITAATDLGVRVWTDTEASALITDASGAVVGANLTGTHSGTVTARRGVILAAGGFGGNFDVRAALFPHETDVPDHTSLTVGHDGDALRLAEEMGGHLDYSPSQPAAWAPLTTFRGKGGREDWFPHVRAFALPGLVAVDREGRRIANEALSYHDYCIAMIERDVDKSGTYGWVLADSATMRRYGIGYAKPWPFPRSLYTSAGYLVSARTLAELAEKIGVDLPTLRESLSRFNDDARLGRDTEYRRGDTEYERLKGDPSHSPNPSLAPVERPPFYAAKITVGDLGTFAGLAVTPKWEVLDDQDRPIPGLFAVGSAAVSPFGGAYPGYGSHIGPALVSGFRAAEELTKDVEPVFDGQARIDAAT